MIPGSRGPRYGVLAIAALAAILSVVDARRDGATADEPLHVAGSVALARYGSWAVIVEHPPLSKALYGAAALAAGARDEPPLSYRDLFRSARAQLFAGRPGVPRDRVLLAVRGAATGVFVLLILAAAGAAGSPEAALLAAALVAGQTALFPHGHLATTDLPATLAIVLAVWATAAFASKATALRFFAAALAAGAALAAKQTALVLLPLLPLLVVPSILSAPAGEERRRRVTGAVLLPISAIVVLALLLRPVSAGDPPGTLALLARIHRLSPDDTRRALVVERLDRGLGRYALATLFVARQTEVGRRTYFLGTVTTSAPRSYHLVAVLVKSPLAWLLLVGAGLSFALRRGSPERGRLLVAAAALCFLSALGGPKIGVRHVFPAVVLASAGAASALAPALSRHGRRALVAATLLALSPLAFGRALGRFGASARLFPSPPLADSNLDWGQDLPRLAELARQRGIPPSSLGVAYFGGDLPSLRIPGCVDLLEADASLPRYVAVSRQLLLVGPETALFAEGRSRAARVVAELKARDAGFVARAGDSIDLFELPPPR